MRTRVFRYAAVALMTALLFAAAGSGPVSAQSGDLFSPIGINGTGAWITPGTTSIHYEVTLNGGLYHYLYRLTVPVGSPSHLILQVSGNLSSILKPEVNGVPWPAGDVGFETYGPSASNPGMPGSMWWVKFDNLPSGALVDTFGFDSDRVPVWGDFYTKDGSAGGQGTNAAWNAGFGFAYGNRNDTNSILVPDTELIPEWGSLALAALALPPVVLVRRRFDR